MLRPPVPNADRAMLEHCGPEELLAIFEACLKTGFKGGVCRELPEAWGTLFTDMYLSANELVDEIEHGGHGLSKDQAHMLREFIRKDCTTGGTFVLDVIRKGGMTDRAALFMIADPETLAAVENTGTTAIHMLTEACDRGVRPALIRRAGVRLLSEVYDGRGIPVLFSIFTLGDLCRDDLDAIASVFTGEELEKVMNRNRTGKNALEIFLEASERLKVHAPGERNKFFVSHAIKTTNMESDLRMQVSSHGQHDTGSGTHAQTESRKKSGQQDMSGIPSAAERYDSMVSDPLDDIGKMLKKKREL